MNKYSVYVKSHCEASDFEAEYTERELKNRKCKIPYIDDVEEDEDGSMIGTGGECGGKLIKTHEGLKCQSCKQVYREEE